MKKQKLLNDIEIHQSIMQTLFRLAKTNIIESANSIIDIYDENHPISFNFILVQTIYTISMFRMNDFDIYSNFLKQIEIFEENNKIKSKIFDVFEGILLSKYSEESKYILYYLFENKFLQSPKVDYKRTNECFAHHMTQEEINEYYCYGIKQYIKKHYEELSKNDWELHKKYIEEGHNPNEITKIIRNDEIEKLQEISSQNDFDFNQIIEPSVYERCDFINQYRITLIEYAAFFSSIKCFKYLLMNGAKVENTGKYAIAGGNIEIIHLCEQNHSSFKNAYETAIKFHCNDIFKYLYENKLEDIKNLEFLGKKCIKWNNYELFTYLQKEGMEINDDIINAAARIGNIYLTKYFMKEHHTPKDILGYSSKSGNIELVKYILDQEGIDINAKDNGDTALMLASFNGYTEIVKLLLEQEGNDINAKNESGSSALIFASWNSHTEIVKLLLEQKGIDINAKDKDDETALMKAYLNGQLEIKLLLEQEGIDINVKDKDGWTALILASWKGYTEIVKLLLEQEGIDINAKSKDGFTALMIASRNGHTEIVKLLLEQEGIDINARDKYGDTALICASSNGHTEIVKLLNEKGAN